MKLMNEIESKVAGRIAEDPGRERPARRVRPAALPRRSASADPRLMFHKILIANRGEIALRIIRTCREMGIRTVVAHSTADADSLPVRLADESICIGPPEARQSYLNIPSIISAAVHHRQRGHPPRLRPPVRERRLRGDLPSVRHHVHRPRRRRPSASWATRPRRARWPSRRARRSCRAARGRCDGVDEAQALADTIGYPVMVKAAAGGGGRGMRIVREREVLARAFATCQAEAAPAFGSSELYLEKFVDEARHVEVQVLGRQERHPRAPGRARLLRAAPAPEAPRGEARARAISAETRAGLYKAALDGRRTRSTTSRPARSSSSWTGTGPFYFIEMNTRIQVEHPVTEMVTGIDLVREQIRIASGEALGYKQSAIDASRPRHRVPDQRRGSRALRPLPGHGDRLDRRRAGPACGWTAT